MAKHSVAYRERRRVARRMRMMRRLTREMLARLGA